MSATALHPGLSSISRLFSYPDAAWRATPPPPGVEIDALLAGMRAADPILLENEYVRLFINAMPELPCAPYGSVYLEGSVMGESTVKVAGIYRKYGMETAEPADHIAAESEFLAWLHGRAAGDAAAGRDFASLLGHLRQWTDPFFREVDRHDRLGWYRRGAAAARSILAGIA